MLSAASMIPATFAHTFATLAFSCLPSPTRVNINTGFYLPVKHVHFWLPEAHVLTSVAGIKRMS